MKIKANGIQINYEVEGDGPWLVMSHSLACDLHMWDEQLPALKGKYRVLRFDTRGHGGSDAPDGAYTLDMLADDLHGLLAAMKVERPHFVGLSMGGMIGMTYALKHPGTLRSLVLCDTSSRIPPEALPVWQERIQTVAAGNKIRNHLPDGPEQVARDAAMAAGAADWSIGASAWVYDHDALAAR